MKVTLSVTELTKVFKEIQAQPERIFEMMRAEMNHGIGEYLTVLAAIKRIPKMARVEFRVFCFEPDS